MSLEAKDINIAGGLVLDLERLEEPVIIGGERYIVREWLGGDKVKYDRAKTEGIDIVVDGDKRVLKNAQSINGRESFLVSLCLFRRMPDGSEQSVSEATVQGWPARVQTKLYEIAQRVCRIKDEEEEKPDPKG